MEILKRGPQGVWYVRYYCPATGKRVMQSLKQSGRKSDAEKAAGAVVLAAEERAKDARDGKPALTLTECLGRYVRALGRRASARHVDTMWRKTCGTLGDDRWALKADMLIHTLSPRHMGDLVAARTAEGNGPQTIAHELKTLRAAVRLAASDGFRVNTSMLDGSVRNAWRTPKAPVKTRYLTPAEFQAAYAWLAPNRPIVRMTKDGGVSKSYTPSGLMARDRQDAQDILVALAYTGMRWSELATLRWHRVDLTPDQVVIRVWASKVERERLLVAPPILADILRRRARMAPTADSPVFPGESGGERPVACGAISRAFTAVGINSPEKVASLGKATLHSLRHTFASTALQAGAGIAEVQQALGHSNIMQTRRYAHLEQRANSAKLAALVGAGLQTGAKQDQALRGSHGGAYNESADHVDIAE